jgi:hypothetical protein
MSVIDTVRTVMRNDIKATPKRLDYVLRANGDTLAREWEPYIAPSTDSRIQTDATLRFRLGNVRVEFDDTLPDNFALLVVR